MVGNDKTEENRYQKMKIIDTKKSHVDFCCMIQYFIYLMFWVLLIWVFKNVITSPNADGVGFILGNVGRNEWFDQQVPDQQSPYTRMTKVC